jgi:hypothetical protein
MICRFPHEILALYVEADLPESQGNKVRLHLSACAECRQFCDRLEQSQAALKSLRREAAGMTALSSVRHDVLSRVQGGQGLGWAIRLERFLWLGLLKPQYAMAGFAFLAIISVSVLGQIQIQQTPSDAGVAAALFDGSNALLRPDGYREWVLVGHSAGVEHQAHESLHKVYIDPVAFRSFALTRRFPEGTVIILETAESGSLSLEASVKDSSRFEGGWGYFKEPAIRARSLSEANGCRSCHQNHAETDHVFTQFYPALRSIGTRS